MFDFDVVKWVKVFRKHGLPMQVADIVLSDPGVKIYQDEKGFYSEERWLAFGLLFNSPVCICFALRGVKPRVITVFRIHEKEWRKRHEYK